MFKTTCCGGSAVEDMEKQDKEPQEKEIVIETMVPPQPLAASPPPPPPLPAYKLTYFNARIGGEMIRLIFHKVGIPFEDRRIEGSEWAGVKAEVQWGKLPVLEFDGYSIYSSTAISRLLAKRFGLAGRNELDAAKCDELVEVCQDLRIAWSAFFFGNEAQKEENKANLLKMMSPNLQNYEAILEKNEGSWLVGSDGCTWADIFVANFLDICQDSVDPKLLDEYPSLKRMKDAVFTFPEIKKYVENRPQNSH